MVVILFFGIFIILDKLVCPGIEGQFIKFGNRYSDDLIIKIMIVPHAVYPDDICLSVSMKCFVFLPSRIQRFNCMFPEYVLL